MRSLLLVTGEESVSEEESGFVSVDEARLVTMGVEMWLALRGRQWPFCVELGVVFVLVSVMMSGFDQGDDLTSFRRLEVCGRGITIAEPL